MSQTAVDQILGAWVHDMTGLPDVAAQGKSLGEWSRNMTTEVREETQLVNARLPRAGSVSVSSPGSVNFSMSAECYLVPRGKTFNAP